LPEELLKKYWGHGQFRPLQKEIIQSVLAGHDTLALLPTGGGKSVCYQVPAMMMDGLCLVISPLIALMRDQVGALNDKGIKALAIHSGLSAREADTALDNAIYGGYKFLYISPERLGNEVFNARAPLLPVNLIAVDEAHCISQWGYDFRPSYLKIASIREHFPKTPILALTATATQKVKTDIMEKLEFRPQSQAFQAGYDRPNLIYAVIQEEDKRKRVPDLLKKTAGPAIIYTRNRRSTKEIAVSLKAVGISADYYHAGLEMAERNKKQESWKENKIRVMVCTNAFGMGIDKADVRQVIHYDIPDSLEAYYQEAGRGGRDGKKAFAIALAGPSDKRELEIKTDRDYPDVDEVKRVYHALGNFFQLPEGAGQDTAFDFNISDFCAKYELSAVKVHNALKMLENAGYLAVSEGVYMPSRIMIIVDNHSFYKFQVEHIHFEPLMKFILRAYGGCFEQYVNIKEEQMAPRLKMRIKDVIQQLSELKRLNLIDYRQQNSSPQITYLTERLSNGNLHLPPQYVFDRKKIIKEKIEAVVEYITTTNRCRSKMLLGYFGEEITKNCGHCDYCLKNKSKETTENITQSIINVLREKQPITMADLIKSLPAFEEKNIVNEVRNLIDGGKVKIEGNNIGLKN